MDHVGVDVQKAARLDDREGSRADGAAGALSTTSLPVALRRADQRRLRQATWQRLGRMAPVVIIGVSVLAGCVGPRAPAVPQTAARTAPPSLPSPPPAVPGAERIEHIVVIYMENHSFDNLYGHFPGAEGLDSPATTVTQTDPQGHPYAVLPPVVNTGAVWPAPDPRFPDQLPNAPFPRSEEHTSELQS